MLYSFIFPETPSNCSSLLLPKWKMFKSRDVHILANCVIIDEARKQCPELHVRPCICLGGGFQPGPTFSGRTKDGSVGCAHGIFDLFGPTDLRTSATDSSAIRNTGPKSGCEGVHITSQDLPQVFGNWRISQHVSLSFNIMMPTQDLGIFS